MPELCIGFFCSIYDAERTLMVAHVCSEYHKNKGSSGHI